MEGSLKCDIPWASHNSFFLQHSFWWMVQQNYMMWSSYRISNHKFDFFDEPITVMIIIFSKNRVNIKLFSLDFLYLLLLWKPSQVLFLLYHYFAAAEIYNAIRVFIAAYVWMTGFGNFSYYYVRKDFRVARFAQVPPWFQ